MPNSKITDLEMAITHQDKAIADLSDIVNAQWKEIESLKRQLKKANDKIDELDSSVDQGDRANVKPPHW